VKKCISWRDHEIARCLSNGFGEKKKKGACQEGEAAMTSLIRSIRELTMTRRSRSRR